MLTCCSAMRDAGEAAKNSNGKSNLICITAALQEEQGLLLHSFCCCCRQARRHAAGRQAPNHPRQVTTQGRSIGEERAAPAYKGRQILVVSEIPPRTEWNTLRIARAHRIRSQKPIDMCAQKKKKIERTLANKLRFHSLFSSSFLNPLPCNTISTSASTIRNSRPALQETVSILNFWAGSCSSSSPAFQVLTANFVLVSPPARHPLDAHTETTKTS